MVAPEPVPASVHARRIGVLFLRLFALVVAGAAGIEAANGHWATAAVCFVLCVLCTLASRRVQVPPVTPEAADDPARVDRP